LIMEKFFTCSETVDLPCLLPEDAIWRRLGRNRYLSSVSAAESVKFKLAMHQAFELCRPQGRWLLAPVRLLDAATVLVFDDWRLDSVPFAEFASGADWLWLGAVTVGRQVAELIAASGNDMAAAAIYDAVGSEVADQAIGLLQKIADGELVRSGLRIHMRRFSPGYGNLSLQQTQRRFFEVLELEQLQMSLTPSCIMQPEKSVTAFAAVKKII